MKKLCIIGVGWLGKQLAESELKKEIEIIGIGRSNPQIPNFDFTSFQLAQVNYDLINPKLKQAKYLVFTIPPSGSASYVLDSINFFEKIKLVNPELGIIYLSSSSVLGNATGSLNENSPARPASDNAKKLRAVEAYLEKHWSGQFSILRLAGLAGPNRHPVKYLAGKKDISKGNSPINLIHSEDIIQLIKLLVSREKRIPLIHVVCPDHPTKKDYYTWAAEQMDLEKPHFKTDNEEIGKKVDSIHLKALNFELRYKSVYSFPELKPN